MNMVYLFSWLFLDCTTTVDVVFLADSSGSIGKNNFQMVKQILLRLIRHYSVSESYARIGIIKYHSFPRRVVNLLQSQKLGFLNLERKIRKMRYTKGGTRTGKALAMADKMLKGSRRRLRGKFLQHEQVCFFFHCKSFFFLARSANGNYRQSCIKRARSEML